MLLDFAGKLQVQIFVYLIQQTTLCTSADDSIDTWCLEVLQQQSDSILRTNNVSVS